MTAFERFWFETEDFQVSAGMNAGEAHIEILATPDDPIAIKLAFRSVAHMRRFVAHLDLLVRGCETALNEPRPDAP